MIVIQCDRCGKPVKSDSGLGGDLLIRAARPELSRGHIGGKLEQSRGHIGGKLGKYQFEVLNSRFVSQQQEIVKVDLCRTCVVEITTMK